MNEEERLLVHVEEALLDVERSIALLPSFQPLFRRREYLRLRDLLGRFASGGRVPLGELRPDLGVLRTSSLARQQATLDTCRWALERLGNDARARFLTRRIRELHLELRLVLARGSGSVIELAKQRFARTSEGVGPEFPQAHMLARRWLECRKDEDIGEESRDLAAELVALCRQHGIDAPVASADIATRAAIAGDRLLVMRGVRTNQREARRIFIHEVYGHLLRRRAASRHSPPLRIGVPDCDADEEGRAIYLEEVYGLLSSERRVELAVRHLVARGVLEGQEVGEVALDLVRRGAGPEVTAHAVCRVMRGGGLCREILYLPAFLRVGQVAHDQRIMRLLQSGRTSVGAARTSLQLAPEGLAVVTESCRVNGDQ